VQWRLVLGDGDRAGHDALHARGATNMAIDQALLESAQAGGPPALRFYQWAPACLSFGRNQTTLDTYDADRLSAAGLDVVRRPTGGLAVLHDCELTYSVTAPADLLGGPRSTYHAINALLVRGLCDIGARAALAGPAHSAERPGSTNPCFQNPAAGEVMARDRDMVREGKLVGSAQRCEQRTILQHGSILFDGDQMSLVAYQKTRGPAAAQGQAQTSAGITLKSILGTVPPVTELITALTTAFELGTGIPLAPSRLSEAERTRARELEIQYDSDAWTWRR
jgi:lipoate-protein ligase A